MPEIPFIGGGYRGRSSDQNSQVCQNLFPVMSKDGKTVKALYGTPGLTAWTTEIGSKEDNNLRMSGSLSYSTDPWINVNATLSTEVDPNNRITVDSSVKVSFNGIVGTEADAYIYNDMGEIYTGDFSIRFISKFNHGTGAIWGDYACFVLAKKNTGIDAINAGSAETDDAIFVDVSYNLTYPGQSYVTLGVIEDGTSRGATSKVLTEGVDYYMHITRDDDGGTNSTGQIKLYICTGGYYGSGGTLVDTQTINCAAAEQNDFRYIYWESSVTEIVYDVSWSGYTQDLKYKLSI